MLRRKLAQAVAGKPVAGAAVHGSAPARFRWLSATPRQQGASGPASAKRTPSLADIEPDNHEAFNEKQKAFRQELQEAKKAREASGSPRSQPQPQSQPTSSAPSSSSSSSTSSLPLGLMQGLGMLSTASGRAAEVAEKEPPRRAGPLTNLIYGTKEGREMDAQLEASFSAVLARGKYVHSIVFHEVKPDKVDEYVELVGEWYPRMASLPENKVHLVGSWRTEVGDCDTFGTSDPLRCLFALVRRDFPKLTRSQSISGSTSATRAITPRCTPSLTIQSSLNSTGGFARSSIRDRRA